MTKVVFDLRINMILSRKKKRGCRRSDLLTSTTILLLLSSSSLYGAEQDASAFLN